MPEVTLVKAETRNILRTVGQPGFVEAYEQTSIFSKIPGFIEKWNVDIGDKVKKNQVLATLFVPELVEEYGFKQATVVLDKVLVEQAERLVDSADGTLKAAIAKVTKAKADVGKFDADVVRWQSEVKRLTGLVAQRVVDQQMPPSRLQKQMKKGWQHLLGISRYHPPMMVLWFFETPTQATL
jgi:multidrug efflux pump subunit AcrA (membrane-fusion protein)